MMSCLLHGTHLYILLVPVPCLIVLFEDDCMTCISTYIYVCVTVFLSLPQYIMTKTNVNTYTF